MKHLADFFGSPDIAHNGSFAVLAAMWLIVMCRVSAVIMTAPGFGETTAPARVRAALTIAVTCVLLPVVYKDLYVVSGEAVRMPAQLLKIVSSELLCGLFLGLTARILCFSLSIAGQIISVFTGLASVIQTDPQLGSGSTAISHLFSTLTPVVIFSSGLYALPLFALSGSYHVFPAGHLNHFAVNDMTVSLTHTLVTSFRIAMELSAPFILIGTLWPAMLGILNRLTPTIQVYSLAIPAQILGGVFLLALLVQVAISTWQEKIQILLMHLPGIGN